MTSLDRYRSLFSSAEFDALQAALAQPVPQAIRLNTLRHGIQTRTEATAQRLGWELHPVPFCAAGYQVQAAQSVGQSVAYRMGDFYIQDAASMLPVELFTPQPDALILDMAAAPGGKTTHLVSHFDDAATILANDSSFKRLSALQANLQTWGASGAWLTNFNGELLGAWFPAHFDRVLLDAPCSGETLREGKGRKTRNVSESEQSQLQQRQIRLLTSAVQALKVGGEVVYSTCTLAPEENEAVLDALLQAFPAAVRIDAAQNLPFGNQACGLTSFEGQHFAEEVRHAVRLFPHLYATSGFFAAKLTKTDTTPIHASDPPYRAPKWHPLTDREAAHLLQQLQDDFGFALPMAGKMLWQDGDQVYWVAEAHHQTLMTLPYYGAGLLLGHWQRGQLIPAHELITRYESDFGGQRLRLDAEHSRIWLTGQDVRGLPMPPQGIVLCEDDTGRFIGRGKVAGNRLRNLLPKRLMR